MLADCVGAAYGNLQRELITGRVVLMGCPKFDNSEDYIHRFAEIFKTAEVNSVTVAIMEVPCCSRLSNIVDRAVELSGVEVPVERVVIGIQGELRSRS